MQQRSHVRIEALGVELVRVHNWLRGELAALRTDITAKRPRKLQAHCAAFCAALVRHHSGEDTGAFPLLIEQFPALAPVIEKLREDHVLVADILQQLEDLMSGVSDSPNDAEIRRVQSELDGLAAILESHFGYEERQLVRLLDGLDVQEWRRETPDFLRR
jgi:iron-sulfur cluster repair protein YtfE (RIC family)